MTKFADRVRAGEFDTDQEAGDVCVAEMNVWAHQHIHRETLAEHLGLGDDLFREVITDLIPWRTILEKRP